jgi:cold shock protein
MSRFPNSTEDTCINRFLGQYLDLMVPQQHRRALRQILAINAPAGFGFIRPDDRSGPNSIFLHITAAQASGVHDLREGDRLTYELVAGRDGRERAVNPALITAARRARAPRLG